MNKASGEFRNYNVSFLLQILCSLLLLHTVLGLPFSRQTIVKSAREDDLISGTDFLSVFIGASIPRSGSINRSRNFNKRLDSDTSEQSFAEHTTVFVPRTAPKDSNSLQVEAFDSSSTQQDNSHTESEQDTVDEVSTGSTGVSTIQSDDNDAMNNEAQKSSLPSTSMNGANAQIVGAEPMAASSKGNEHTLNSSSDFTADSEPDTEKDERNFFSASSSNIPPSVSFELDEISTRPSSNSTTTETLSDKASATDNDHFDTSEIPIENKTFYTNPVSSKEDKNTADWSSLDAIEDDTTENQTHKVVSVRVSSSVALGTAQQSNKINHDNKYIYNTFLDSFAHDEFHRSSPESASLVTEKEPAATAVQRSQLSVEEASPSSSIISVHQESSSSDAQSRHSDFDSQGSSEPPSDPQLSPVSYHTSVSTATSNSRVQFYREPPSYHRTGSSAAETVQRTVVAQQPQPQSYGQTASVFQTAGDSSQLTQSSHQTSSSQRNVNADRQTATQQFEGETSRAQKSYITHKEPPERNYELLEENYGTPERSYATPEENYEVDEAVSVMTNGRAHGVQFPAVTTTDPALREFNSQQGQSNDPNSKFGYVVEGRNFRKYQVEERTPDGFIVGEYGVVSHDDGSLRGVRYTADGTINPRVIYDALAKFLSL
jgi:hypothetical protein